MLCCVFFFQAEDGIRDLVRSRGLGDVYKRQAAYMPVYAKEAGGRVVIVNLTATSYDMMADEVINRKAGEVMSAVMEAVRKRLS